MQWMNYEVNNKIGIISDNYQNSLPFYRVDVKRVIMYCIVKSFQQLKKHSLILNYTEAVITFTSHSLHPNSVRLPVHSAIKKSPFKGAFMESGINAEYCC